MNRRRDNYSRVYVVTNASLTVKYFLQKIDECAGRLKMNDMDEELKDHEEEFFAIKVTGVDDGHGHLAVSPAGTPADFDHFGEDHHSNVEFEDIDVTWWQQKSQFSELSKAPEWFVNLDEDTQKRVEHLFEDENNVDKGKLK